MADTPLLSPVTEEFEGAEFGDERLNRRLEIMASTLERVPEHSISRASKSVADREGAYRFLENRRVTMDALLEPHQEATARRCREEGSVYVVSDTSEFTFSGAGRGKKLGRIQGERRGFLGHVALAVSTDAIRTPLGVLGIESIVRDEQPPTKHRNERQKTGDEDRESLRWSRMVDHAEDVLRGVPAIHVMDAEADAFELLAHLVQHGRRFIVRAARDRVVDDGKLFESVASAPTVLEREVQLSARTRPHGTTKGRGLPARHGRPAKLSVSAKRVAIVRPKRCSKLLPSTLELKVVHVLEQNPPEGQTPVEWLLFTSDLVDTAEQVAAVVDGYRARWVIEEFFKALKTGCAFEGRQLRSVRTLTNALGLFAVIAWRLLLLRALDRDASQAPATDVLEPDLIEALAARLKNIGERKPFPAAPTVADVMKGIARLGGHHKSNGPPGWQLLWFGFQDLLYWANGFIAGKSAAYCDHS